MPKTRLHTLAASIAVVALATFFSGCAKTTVQDEASPTSTPSAAAGVSAKHILVQYKGSMKASPDVTRTQEEAKARIEECLEKARQGEKFEDLALEYSDGPSAPRGGDLGAFGRGMMAPPFEEAAFGCGVGEITDVVETDFGYHIIYRYQ